MKWRHIYLIGAPRTERRIPNPEYTQNPTANACKLAAEACIRLQQRSGKT